MKFFAKKLSVLVFPDLIFIEGTFRCHKLKFQYFSEFLQKKEEKSAVGKNGYQNTKF